MTEAEIDLQWQRRARMIELWRAGWDTQRIAKHLGLPEHEVANSLARRKGQTVPHGEFWGDETERPGPVGVKIAARPANLPAGGRLEVLSGEDRA